MPRNVVPSAPGLSQRSSRPQPFVMAVISFFPAGFPRVGDGPGADPEVEPAAGIGAAGTGDRLGLGEQRRGGEQAQE